MPDDVGRRRRGRRDVGAHRRAPNAPRTSGPRVGSPPPPRRGRRAGRARPGRPRVRGRRAPAFPVSASRWRPRLQVEGYSATPGRGARPTNRQPRPPYRHLAAASVRPLARGATDALRSAREAGQPGHGRAEVRQLHRREVGRRRSRAATSRTSRRSPGEPFTEVARSDAKDIELALDAAHAAAEAWGADEPDRAVDDPPPDRRPDRAEPRDAGDRRVLGERQAGPGDARPPTSRSRSTTSATSPVCSAPRRAASPSSTRTPSPTTSTSRSASSARSSPGTSRSSWRRGSSRRRSRPATA